MNRNRIFTATALALALLAGCSPSEEDAAQSNTGTAATPAAATAEVAAANVTDERLLNAENEPGQWMMNGGTYEETHFVNLDEINRDTIDRLGLAWYGDYDTNLSQQGTPLYIDGVIYVSTAWSTVYAYDAKTGEQLWHFDPKTPKEIAIKVCCGIVNRGIAAYEGKIYLGALDGNLYAIDAKTGQEVWHKQTVDVEKQYTVTSAPRIIKGQVVIGNSGSEFGVRGYLGAYDARTGEDLWRVYTVPGNPELGFENPQMEMAAKTWSGNWWELGGGGTVWDAIVYDEVNNLIMFGTGNGTPWDQRVRDPGGGDNLFVASVLAVNADTGEYAWHYQTTPGDTWDYDAMSPIMLLTLPLGDNGADRRVVVQPNKNGMIYVLDAASGELLSGDAFTEVNWNTGIDMATGRPIEVPAARYDRDNIFNLAPGVQGGHGWHANAFNPETGLIYIAAQRAWFVMRTAEGFVPNPQGTNLGIDMGASFVYYADNPDARREFVGYVSAWDPVARKEVWRSEELPGPTGGILSTAGGLVFSGGGNNNNVFRAYNTETGEKVWEFQTQTGMVAAPITFELDGKQYIAASVGVNQAGNYYAPNYSRLLVFTLDGTAQLPEAVTFEAPQLNPPALTASAEVVARGQEVYNANCSICHGNGGLARGANFPNLLVSPMLHSQQGFDSIVLQGARAERGMPNFAEKLTPEDSQAVLGYLVSRAAEQLAAQQAAPPIAAPPPAAEDVHEETEQN